MELHCLVFPFQLRFGHRRDVCEICKAKVKRQPSLSKGQWSSHTLSLIFCLTEDGVVQQQELQTPDPNGSTPQFLQTVGQVKSISFFCTSLHHQMTGHEWPICLHDLQLSLLFLCIMPHFSSWLLSLLIYSNFMFSSVTFHSTHSCIQCTPYNWFFIVSLRVVLPLWLNLK